MDIQQRNCNKKQVLTMVNSWFRKFDATGRCEALHHTEFSANVTQTPTIMTPSKMQLDS